MGFQMLTFKNIFQLTDRAPFFRLLVPWKRVKTTQVVYIEDIVYTGMHIVYNRGTH